MYSQLGQDDWVLSIFPINNGFFVDVGYRHPININNTYLLELNGWSGIGVDPLLSYTESPDPKVLTIPESISLRPKTKLINNAVFSVSNKKMVFLKKGVYSAIKTFEDFQDLDNLSNNEILVETKTLEDILVESNAPTNIHYLSLDTEGSEYEILKVFPFDKFNFGCVTVEHNKNQEKKAKLLELFLNNNYEISKNVRHDFFIINKNYKNIFDN